MSVSAPVMQFKSTCKHHLKAKSKCVLDNSVQSNTSFIVSSVIKERVIKPTYKARFLPSTFKLKLIFAQQAIQSCFLCVLTNIPYRSS